MDLSNSLSLAKLQHLTGSSLKDIRELFLLDETLKKNVGYQSNGFSFGANAEAGIQIKLFNDPTDDNEDELAKNLGLDNFLDNQAFLNYNISGRLKGSAAAEIGSVGFDFSADQNILLACYLQHDKNNNLLTAIKDDLKNFKILIDKNSTLNLKKNEALAMTLRGSLKFEGDFQLSDVITASVGEILNFIPGIANIDLEVSSGIQLSAKTSINDDFEIIIQCLANELYLVKIKKTLKKETNGNGGLKVGAEIQDPKDHIETLIDKLFDHFEKELSRKVYLLIKKIDENQSLTQNESNYLQSIADTLQLPGDNSSTEKIAEAYINKRKELKDKITSTISSKVSIAATYGYSKKTSNDVIFEGHFNSVKLDEHYKNIIKLNVAPIINDFLDETSSGIELKEFKEITNLEINSAFNIGVKLGNFELKQGSTKIFSIEENNIIENSLGMFKINNISVGRKYERVLGNNDLNTCITLNATLDNYVPKDSLISCSMLDYEFSVVWEITQNKTNEEELRRYLDLAVLWNILPSRKFSQKVMELEKLLVEKRIKSVKYKAFMKAPYKIFDILLKDLVQADEKFISKVLSASTPYADISGRNNLMKRSLIYYGFWLLYSKQKPSTLSIPRIVEEFCDYLEKSGYYDLADFEYYGLDDNFNHLYAGQSLKNSIEYNFIYKNFLIVQSRFNILFQNFHKSYQSQIQDNKKIRIKLFSPTKLQQEINMRFYGRLIIDLAIKNNLEEGLEKGFTIEYTDSQNQDITIILG